MVQDVPPRQLGALLRDWPARGPEPQDRPSVRGALGPVLAPLWEADGAPLSGARAALHLAGALPDDGVVVADPGPAGFWVARATPSSFPGSVCVPATAEPGFAAAAAVVAALDGRPCLAVTDEAGADHPVTRALGDLAAGLGVRFGMQVWGAVGSMASADDHVELLGELIGPADGTATTGSAAPRFAPVPVDLSIPDELIERAGEVVAWVDRD